MQALKNKSTDLKLCLSQQTNAFEVLPITNLQRLRRGYSLRTNKVLTYNEFEGPWWQSGNTLASHL